MDTLQVELKHWEHEFYKEYRRKPSKNDIKQNKIIFRKYLLYSKMKKENKQLLNQQSNDDKTLHPVSFVKQFNYKKEDQSTISPPPISPPQEPDCEESFLSGYFSCNLNTKQKIQVKQNKQKESLKKPIFTLNIDDSNNNNIISNNDTKNEEQFIPKIDKIDNITESTNDTFNSLHDNTIVPNNYFLFKSSNSFGGLSTLQISELSKNSKQDDLDIDILKQNELRSLSGKKRKLKQDYSISNVEPQRKKRKINHSSSIHESTSNDISSNEFKWKGSNVSHSNNFVKLNLRKGKRNTRSTKRKRIIKGSSSNNNNISRVQDTANNEYIIDDYINLNNDIMDIEDNINILDNNNIQNNVYKQDHDITNIYSDDSKLLTILQDNFGYSTFRNGQLDAIKYILKGQSSLVCIPTGSGKSLIYQFPALLMPKNSIILVISPLLSLINDQLKQLPKCLTGASINSSQSKNQINSIYQAIKDNRINILFISPEKLMSTDFQDMISPLNPNGLGINIFFTCIDEAHCISQWSHNFRPSYLRISGILRNILNVNCILALSATCTTSVRDSICNLLSIDKTNIIIQSPVRNNLNLSVSSDKDKYSALLRLLESVQYKNLSSIIIYCMFQQDTEHLASFLQSNKYDALAYHAGKTYSDRKSVQKLFMSNKLRIVVATVAFGMGVDKSDVRAVIHFSLPRSIEAYVQEVGRAGRDNLPAYGHLLLNSDDFIRSYKLSFSDYIDRLMIKSFLLYLFTFPKYLGNLSKSYYISLPYQSTSELFDIKKEVLDTLLTYLQLSPILNTTNHFQLLTPTNCLYIIQFHSTDPNILAKKYSFIQAILKVSSKQSNGKWYCDITNLANYFNKDLDFIKNELNKLQTMEELSYNIEDEMSILVYIKDIPKSNDIDNIINDLYDKIFSLQKHKITKLYSIYKICKYAAFDNINEVLEKHKHTNLEKERDIDYQIEKYFTDSLYINNNLNFIDWPILDPYSPISESKLNYLKGDINYMILKEKDTIKSGLIGARILLGLSTPKYPANRFYHYKFWGLYPNVNFFKLVKLINEILLKIHQ